ncbi:MAG: HIRAN domain-containing protein [Desulfobacterales bacterium]
MIPNRRDFLKIFGALPLAAALKSAAAASPAPPEPPTRLLLNRFSIAGLQYYDGLALAHRLKPEAQLELTRESRNPHDPFAVEIHLEATKLGYVPRSDNKHLSRLLEQGAQLECRVIEVDLEAGVWNRVRVEVWMA